MLRSAAILLLCLVLASCGGSAAPTPTATSAPTAGPIVIAGTVSHDTTDRIRQELSVVIADWSDRATVEGLLVDLAVSFLTDSGADAVVGVPGTIRRW
ncbi:MAG TPA: hypothetical protein VMM78_02995 [Thermomicrobiales bacterium]|nr:hypothetical protein [Thermomicrobiales bacterium]